MGRERRPLVVVLCLIVLGGVLTGAVLTASHDDAAPGTGSHATESHAGADAPVREYADPRAGAPAPPAPVPGPDASTGTVTLDCGRNEEQHYNQDNLVVSPGLSGGAHHTHAYVGNLSTDARSTDESLAAAPTSCRGGDRSTYYWPVLRRTDRPATRPYEQAAGHGNAGEVLTPATVALEFRGSPVGKVVPMPRFLRAITGDAVAYTARDDSQVRARWGCSGSPDRSTTSYPRCREGERVTRTLVFPSCWNGLETANPDRTHLVFATANGVCPRGTFAVPELRLSLAYDVPRGVPLALDSFPEQRHSPRTDHAMFVNVMTDQQMSALVACLNEGRQCRAV
ncbi:DUF1996 domain-containing protein [Streptomyces sp. WAC06614]|uniref:DUF1996 domain-containing protein n=1 Tax=Streptomyces sp. WAC06614 TaxID=2487416 RepID=UPI000F787831|nr:DUF1996 domain-containing protein [Streptomyces sp. WAC06614]RSS82276.1 DUF1996 domain-containing protein [Streptomyces sp. WAC06614]